MKKRILLLILISTNIIIANDAVEIINKKDNTNIIYYSDDIESKLNNSINIQAKEIVLQLDILISKMNSFQEKQYIEEFKQQFAKKYFYSNKPIADINRNINKILNDRSNKKLIQYEREINENKQILR